MQLQLLLLLVADPAKERPPKYQHISQAVPAAAVSPSSWCLSQSARMLSAVPPVSSAFDDPMILLQQPSFFFLHRS